MSATMGDVSLEQQRYIYRTIRDRKKESLFVDYNPLFAIRRFSQPRKPQTLSFNDYYIKFGTTEEQNGWRRVFIPEKQKTIYVKQWAHILYMTYLGWYGDRMIFGCRGNDMRLRWRIRRRWMTTLLRGIKAFRHGRHGGRWKRSIIWSLNAFITSSFASIGKRKNEKNMIFVKNFSLLMEH